MELTRNPDISVPPRRFVPEDFDPADLDAIGELVERLLAREIGSAGDLEQWIYDTGELAAQIYGEFTRRLTAMNRDTRDAGLKQRLLSFQGEVMPQVGVLADRITRKYLECPHRRELGDGFAVYDEDKRNEAELFREENTKLEAQARALGARYQEIMGTMSVEIDGEERTLQQAATRLLERDRSVREKAFRAIADRGERDVGTINGIFDEMVRLRDLMGRNADHANYRDYRFRQLRRAYTPEDCAGFHEAVETLVLPVARRLMQRRKEILALDTLRPWDADVSLFGTEPRRLFEDQDGFVALTRKLFAAVDPLFDAEFDVLVRNGMLDLMSRPGKAPGGYNAVGRRGDLRVLLHEGGHAFHSLAAREIPVIDYRHAPTEFCEVASMSMELFGLERLEQVLGAEEAREIAYPHIAGMISGLVSIARIDAFQHWIYTHPGHTAEQRSARWVELSDRFSLGFDQTGIEHYRPNGWQRVMHFFTHPLYYVEYGIATLGAWQLWRLEQEDHDKAVQGYRKALSLGGSRRLPQLFEAAGIRFAMDQSILEDLIPFVESRLARLAPPLAPPGRQS